MRSRNLLPLTALTLACAGCTSVPTLLAEERFHEALSKTNRWDRDHPEVRMISKALTTRLEGRLGIHVFTAAELDELLPWVPVRLRKQEALLAFVEYRLDRSDAPDVKAELENAQVDGRYYAWPSGGFDWNRLNGGRFASLRPKGGKANHREKSKWSLLANTAIASLSDVVWASSLGTLDFEAGKGLGAEVSPLRMVSSQIKRLANGLNPEVKQEPRSDPETARTASEESPTARETLRAEKRRSDEARGMLSMLVDWPKTREDGTTQAVFLLEAQSAGREWFAPYDKEQDVLRLHFFHVYPHDEPCPFGNERGCTATDRVGLSLPAGPDLAERINALFPQGPRPLEEIPFLRIAPKR